MSIWLITSVLLGDDKTLLGATVGEVNETTHAVITPVRLIEHGCDVKNPLSGINFI